MERQKVRWKERKPQREREREKIRWDLGESPTETQPLPEQMAGDKHIWLHPNWGCSNHLYSNLLRYLGS